MELKKTKFSIILCLAVLVVAMMVSLGFAAPALAQDGSTPLSEFDPFLDGGPSNMTSELGEAGEEDGKTSEPLSEFDSFLDGPP